MTYDPRRPAAGRGDPVTSLDVAGWAFPAGTNTRKEHWWPAGSDRSGCRRYGRTLTAVRPRPPYEPGFICAACLRASESPVVGEEHGEGSEPTTAPTGGSSS